MVRAILAFGLVAALAALAAFEIALNAVLRF